MRYASVPLDFPHRCFSRRWPEPDRRSRGGCYLEVMSGDFHRHGAASRRPQTYARRPGGRCSRPRDGIAEALSKQLDASVKVTDQKPGTKVEIVHA
jgi:hypothetical protein